MSEPRSFFRQQAVDEQTPSAVGDAIDLGPMPFRVLSWLMVAFLAALLCFLFWGRYASTEVVVGALMPERGLTKVYPAFGGVMTELLVQEGDMVAQGAPLFVMRSGQALEGFADFNEALVEELERSIALQQDGLEQRDRLDEEERQGLERDIATTGAQLALVRDQIAEQGRHHELLQSELESMRPLLPKKYVSQHEFQAREREALNSGIQRKNLERDAASMDNQLQRQRAELSSLPLQQSMRRADMLQRLGETQQRLIEVQARGGYQVRSPVSGTVATMLFRSGDQVPAGLPVLTVLPEDAILQAELYVPTRARGFISVGQEVLLRYQAFPYQKFGVHKGRIAEVSRTIVDAQELPITLPIGEPTYRVRVALNKQAVLAFGEQITLQPGMLLDAEIVRDRRSLMEWVMEPVYSIKGRR